MKRFSLDLPRDVKKGCALEVFVCVCVCVWEGGMEFVVLGKNVFRLFDLKLWQAMKNLA